MRRRDERSRGLLRSGSRAYAWREPYASLLIWAGLFFLQIATYPLAFILVATRHGGTARELTGNLAGTLWLAIPLGSLYGIRAAWRHLWRPANLLAWTGLILNFLYLLVGMLILAVAALGIHV